jgi:hypothetical protein
MPEPAGSTPSWAVRDRARLFLLYFKCLYVTTLNCLEILLEFFSRSKWTPGLRPG